MVAALVDTSIVVDLLRGYPSAQTWFLAQRDLGVSRAIWLEIIEGTENSTAQRHALRLLRRFELVELTTPDIEWATEKLLQLHLSHNVDAFDCLIAAVNERLGLPLTSPPLPHVIIPTDHRFHLSG